MEKIEVQYFDAFDENELDAPIWRYLDFSKFMDLIENSSIFFPKLEAFEDKFEGIHNAMGENDFYDIDTSGKFVKIEAIKSGRQKENSEKLKAFMSEISENIKKSVGISCWRFSEHESHAMWKTYLTSKEGVAIKTSLTSFIDSIQGNGDSHVIRVGKVKYINYKTDNMPIENSFNCVLYKNVYFEHEKEIRILMQEFENPKIKHFDSNNFKYILGDGLRLKMDYKKMLKEIRVSPYASEWFLNLVKKICTEKYGLDIPINSSIIELRK